LSNDDFCGLRSERSIVRQTPGVERIMDRICVFVEERNRRLDAGRYEAMQIRISSLDIMSEKLAARKDVVSSQEPKESSLREL
jgi:hypothetical protein